MAPKHLRSVISSVLAGALGLALALPASGALYKWTDANGRVVYSDQPPTAPNVQAETLRGSAPAANANAVKELAQKDAEFRKRQAERAESVAKADKERAAHEARSEECSRVASSIQQLSWGQVVIYRANEKGEQVPMDEAARARERSRLDAWMKENCK